MGIIDSAIKTFSFEFTEFLQIKKIEKEFFKIYYKKKIQIEKEFNEKSLKFFSKEIKYFEKKLNDYNPNKKFIIEKNCNVIYFSTEKKEFKENSLIEINKILENEFHIDIKKDFKINSIFEDGIFLGFKDLFDKPFEFYSFDCTHTEIVKLKCEKICEIILNSLSSKNSKIKEMIHNNDLKEIDKFYKISVELKNDFITNRLLNGDNEFKEKPNVK
jgi:hypothetical protein